MSPRREHSYFVYVATNVSGTLYIGMTNNLERRMYQHKHHVVQGFTTRYRIDRLLYYEETNDVLWAIEREKQLKGWVRKRKIDLIVGMNPKWKDLSLDWD